MHTLRLQGAHQLQVDKDEKDLYDLKSKALAEQGGQDAPAFYEGKFITKKALTDEKGNFLKFEYKRLTPQELLQSQKEGEEKKQPAWTPMTFGEVKVERRINPIFANNTELTEMLDKGYSLSYIDDKIFKPAFVNLGQIANSTSNAGGGIVANGNVIKSYLNEGKSSTNETAVKSTIALLKANLADTPQYNAILARAWMGNVMVGEGKNRHPKKVETEEEAQQAADDYIMLQYAKHLNVDTAVKHSQVYDLKGTLDLKYGGDGGGSAYNERMDKVLAERSGGTNARIVSYTEGINGKDAQEVRVLAYDQPQLNAKLKKENASLAAEDGLTPYAMVQDGFFADGTKIKDVKSLFKGITNDELLAGPAGFVLDKKHPLTLQYIPIDVRTGKRAKVVPSSKQEAELKAVNNRYNKIGAKEDSQDRLTALRKVYNSDNIRIMPVYAGRVAYHKDSVKDGEEVGGASTKWIRAHGMVGDAKQVYESAEAYKVGKDSKLFKELVDKGLSPDADDEDDYVFNTIYIPLTSNMSAQLGGANIHSTGLTGETLLQNPGNKPF